MSEKNLAFQILSIGSGGSNRLGPYVQVCGRSADKKSVSVTISGPKPYFWFKLRDDLLTDGFPNTLLLKTMVIELNDSLNRTLNSEFKYFCLHDARTDMCSLVELGDVTCKYDYYGYSALPHYYAQLRFGCAKALTAVRYMLTSPLGGAKRRPAFSLTLAKKIYSTETYNLENFYRYKTMNGGISRFAFTLAEANISHENQVLADLYIQPGEWVELSNLDVPVNKNSSCDFDLEYRPDYGELGDCIRKVDNSINSPLRVFSWDLEVYCNPIGNSGAMKFYGPDEVNGKILCASAVSYEYGSTAMTSVVFCLADRNGQEQVTATDGQTKVTLKWYTDEPSLITEFLDYMREVDPDVVTGYNTEKFDWPHLIGRLKYFNCLDQLQKLPRYGAVTEHVGQEDAWNTIDIPGRIVHDMCIWTKKNRQYREYKLDFVCKENEIDGKDDVSYNQIAELSKTHEGRVKLAVYCELDSRLVCMLVQKKSLDPLGKTLSLSSITGVNPEDLLFRGSMNTLRACILRYAHRDNFLLSCPSYGDNKPKLADDEEDHSEDKYEGGKVLKPITGFYRDPVVTLDFGSLYPSCMMEMNMCCSTSLSRQEATVQNIPYNQPPCPSLNGIWMLDDKKYAKVYESSEKKDDYDIGINFSFYSSKDSKLAQFTNELNAAIIFSDGTTAELSDGGYQLNFSDGRVLKRRDSDVLVFVQQSVLHGTIPKIEEYLKKDRVIAKGKLKACEKAGDENGESFYDNLQSSIKVVMNALYGALGSQKGGIFPNSGPVAAAITARGRSQICMVKSTLEQNFYMSGTELVNCEQLPEGQKGMTVIYGDTDSVMILFPTCNLQQAAIHGDNLSKWFGKNRLAEPHKLEFEKILYPSAFYKPKMYCAFKYEKYGEDAREKAKVFARGLSSVRRDNALIVKETVLKTMDMMFKQENKPEEILAYIGKQMATIHNSIISAYCPGRFDGQLPFDSFIQSAGVSKKLADYDADNAATTVAKQLMELDPSLSFDKNTRVTFVVTAAPSNTKRRDQALLPELAQKNQTPLDAEFYTSALTKKLAPLISCFYMDKERKERTVKDALGRIVELAPKRVADQNKLLGQATAEKLIEAAFKSNKLLQPKRSADSPPSGGAAKKSGQQSIASFFFGKK